MLARRLTTVLSRKVSECSHLRDNRCSLARARAYSVDHEMKQYKWREKEADLDRVTSDDDPEKPKTFLWFPTHAFEKHSFSIGNIRNWYANHRTVLTKHDQRFIPARHEALGADLATAHFIVSRGGKVRLQGNARWIEKDSFDLPKQYDPSYIVDAVDVNGFDLHYEGLSNICGLKKLEWLSLKDCKNIDDWGLDKISAEFPRLNHLDISGCEKITERGLESLYRMYNLKTLIVTNHDKNVAFELTCMMLEDCMPNLVCEIHTPQETSEGERE